MEPTVDWITTWIETLGHWGIFCLMVLEHLFPPIPSELIMPLAGFTSSASNDISLTWAIAAGTAGSFLGTLTWYAMGCLVKEEQIMRWVERYRRWLFVKPKDVKKAISFFQQGNGIWVVGIGRVIPGIRTYVSVPAGLSHMPLILYGASTLVGTFVWTAALAIAGYFLGNQFEQVQVFLAPIAQGVLILLAISLLVWVFRRYKIYRLF